jgi:hypothetical protein
LDVSFVVALLIAQSVIFNVILTPTLTIGVAV